MSQAYRYDFEDGTALVYSSSIPGVILQPAEDKVVVSQGALTASEHANFLAEVEVTNADYQEPDLKGQIADLQGQLADVQGQVTAVQEAQANATLPQ